MGFASLYPSYELQQLLPRRMGPSVRLLQPDLRQILEPVLRLHELLHLRRQRVRVGVVHHPHQRGVVDDLGVRLRQQFVLPGDIEVLLGLVDQRIDLRVLVAAPVDADRRDLAGVEEADDGVQRIRGDIGDVVGR